LWQLRYSCAGIAIRPEGRGRGCGAGACTAFDVSRGLTWTRRDRPFPSLAPFHQMLAVIETAYHLRLLAALGRVVPGDADGITCYAPAVARPAPA